MSDNAPLSPGPKEKEAPGNGDCPLTCTIHQPQGIDPYSRESACHVKQHCSRRDYNGFTTSEGDRVKHPTYST